MRSAGLDLQPWIDKDLLLCHASRPSLGGLEMHLALMLKAIQDEGPSVVVVDPLSSLLTNGIGYQSAGMMLRLVDYIKNQGVTALFLSLQEGEEPSDMHISSIMDTWIVVRNVRSDTELSRRLHIVKARGMAHSHHIRRMEITNTGVRLTDASDTSQEFQ
jgi:circadian clock protein KaiC